MLSSRTWAGVVAALSITAGMWHRAEAQPYDAAWIVRPTHGFDARTTFAIFGPLRQLDLELSMVNEGGTDWIRIEPGFFGAVAVRLVRGDAREPIAALTGLRDEAICSWTGRCSLSLGVDLPPGEGVMAFATLEPLRQGSEIGEGDYHIELDFSAARPFLRGVDNQTWGGRFRTSGRVPLTVRLVETADDRREYYRIEGSVALLQDRDFTRALAMFEAYVKEFPTEAGGYSGAGAALLELGRFDEAATMLEKAMSLRVGDRDPERLAAAYVGMGQEARARAILERYVRVSDVPAALERAQQRVATIRTRR